MGLQTPASARHLTPSGSWLRRHRPVARLVAVVAALAVVLPLGYASPGAVRAADFLVTTNVDTGAGSLRQAILDANAAAGADTIGFTGAMTISPASPLPDITDAVTIDGTSVATPGGPGVGIDGAAAGTGVDGLTLGNGSGATTIRALRITGFEGSAIRLSDASGATIEGNHLADCGNGISVVGTSTNIVIGGVEPIKRNTIESNAGRGISVADTATGVSIRQNVIRDNSGLGIDLGNAGGVTLNDAGDADSGPNGLQNFPVITAATATGTTISGTLDSGTGSYVIEVFESAACDPAGHGEGSRFLASGNISAPGSWAVDAGPINGTFLSATATNVTTGETSEFGPCFLVTNGLPAFGTWAGKRTAFNGGVIPGAGDLIAAGTNAPAGPAQFTYGALDGEPNGGAASPSATWTFYTTARANETINVPWRWSGFHGYAAVNVRLEAFVIRDLDLPVSNQVLQAPPTQSCNPCVEPSGGFDYDGTVAFTVQPGDIYGFRITTSNGDTNASLYGQLILGNAVPQDCRDAQEMYSATADGRYVIHPQGGQQFSVHCAGMAGAATKEYLTLTPELTGPGQNFASYGGGGAAAGTTVTTSFTKVRINPSTLAVDIGDRTFATSTGNLTHPDSFGNQIVTSMPYGTAMGCGVAGSANVDLRGTPFAINDTWTVRGTGSTGTVSHFANVGESFFETPQFANITGDGNCGWNSPKPDAFNPFNPVAGDFSLQLRYLTASPTPPAPVLFRAAPNGTNAQTGVVGRLNATPGAYTLKLYASTTCTDGVLGGEPVALGTATVTIGADNATYFAQRVSHSTNTFRYVALTAVKDGYESDTSSCIVAQADNDVWPRAANLNVGATPTTGSGWIDQPGSGRWYKFHVDPGAQLTINLTGLAADYDLFLFKDIGAAYDEHADIGNNADLTRLSAEFAAVNIAPQAYAPQAYAPQAYAPQAYAPQAYAPQAYAPQAYAPQAYAPQAYAPQAYAPQAYASDAYAPQAYAPDIFLPQAYASAQVTTLVAISAHTGTDTETIVANTWNNASDFYVRVSGKNGGFSTDEPFELSVTMKSEICDGIQLDTQAPISVSGAPETLILTDLSRMPVTTPGNSVDQKAALSAKLAAFAQQVDGAVVNVGSDPGVIAMNRQADDHASCPFAKNVVAHEIKDIVDAYRANAPGMLKYVVLVGDDNVIPFFRYADQALLGPEQDFVPPVDPTSASEASLRSNYVLGQDEYGASVTLSHGFGSLPVPELPVGRLVETAADATIALDGFLALPAGVVPTPKSSLVTGYDFIADAAGEIQEALEEGMDTPAADAVHDSLITPFDVSPLDPSAWDAAKLNRELAKGQDLIFLGGHFSADSALAADFSTSITTADLPNNLTNAIVFSIGCHSGYNTVDGHGVPGVTQTLDWAQALARKQATLVAGTGYQYGDTDFLEYSERIYLEFARELRRGKGAVAVGDALIRSKQSYLRTTNDLRGLHQKSLLESVLYGLPMVAVDMPAGRLPATTTEASIADAAVAYATDPGAALGLTSDTVAIASTLTSDTKDLDVIGAPTPTTIEAKWYTGSAGVVTHQGEPALPLEVRNVSVADKVLRGVLWLGGKYTEETVVPLTGAPATESRGMHTPFASPVFYPIRPWSVNYTDALASSTGSTQLLVTPAQHKGSPISDEATLRTYGTMDFKLFYSSYPFDGGVPAVDARAAALSAAPEISVVSAAANGDQVSFEARVTGNPAAGVQEVWINYTTGAGSNGIGEWIDLKLTQDENDTTLWRATTTITGAASVSYLVQAVNGLGLVALSDNYGEYYAVGVAGVQPPPATETVLDVTGPPSGVHAADATFTATLRAGATALPGKRVVVRVGGTARSAETVLQPDGTAIATVALPMLVLPGTYDVFATFAGDSEFASSSATRSVSVTEAPTTLTLAPASPASAADGSVTYVATLESGAAPLAQRTVAFLATSSAGAVSLKTATTDLVGNARLRFPTGMAGVSKVEVRFGSLVAGAAGAEVDLTDARYLASSAFRWPLTAFLAPVDNAPTVNVVRASSAVPVKFSLGGNHGLDIFRTGYPKVVAVTCATGVPIDEIETTVAASTSGLQYDSTSRTYTYIWKTPKKVGCYRVDLVFVEGTAQSALFKLR